MVILKGMMPLSSNVKAGRDVYLTYSGMQAWVEAPLLQKALKSSAAFRRDTIHNASDTWHDTSVLTDLGRMRFAADARRRHVQRANVFLWIQTRESLGDVFLLLDLFWAMHHRINIVSLNLTDGGYDFEVAKNTLKQLPETLASTAGGVASTLVEGMGVTLERFQEIVTIAATSILSLDFRSMRALSSAATEALVKDIAARLESEPPPLPTSHSWSESPTTGKGSPCPSVSHEPSSPLRVPKVVIVP